MITGMGKNEAYRKDSARMFKVWPERVGKEDLEGKCFGGNYSTRKVALIAAVLHRGKNSTGAGRESQSLLKMVVVLRHRKTLPRQGWHLSL